MSETAPEIVVAGHICLDILPSFGDQHLTSDLLTPGKLVHVGPATLAVGGAVANTGLALHRLGVATRLMGKVGDDLFGQSIREIVQRQDARLAEGMLVAPGANSSYSVILSLPGLDRTIFHHAGVNDTYAATDVPLEQASSGSLFHFGYPPLMRAIYEDGGVAFAELLQSIKARGVTTSLDMALPDPTSETDWPLWLKRVLPFVDIFSPSGDEIQSMLEYGVGNRRLDGQRLREIGTRLLAMGAAVVALKIGDQGLYLRTTTDEGRLQQMGTYRFQDWRPWHNRELLAPCFRVEVAGTTGAGDCTIAGLLAAILRDCGPEESLLSATAVGACSVEKADATSGVPDWSRVRQRVQEGWPQLPLTLALPGWRYASGVGLWKGPDETHF